jgi:hypothetical protein
LTLIHEKSSHLENLHTYVPNDKISIDEGQNGTEFKLDVVGKQPRRERHNETHADAQCWGDGGSG